MSDARDRPARPVWWVLGAAGACALALAAFVKATGGVDWSLGPLRLRVHSPWRLLSAGSGLLLTALVWGGAPWRAVLARVWDARDRHAPWIAASAAVVAAAVGFARGTRVAGSADSYGYVSQALLWLKGLPIQPEPLAAVMPWPLAELTLSPLGYMPGTQPGVIVPTYPPGLPLMMAAFAGIAGADAVYWVVPLLGAGAVWLAYLIGRRYADPASGAAAAVLVAASPVFLFQIVQPMSDVPVTTCWLLSLWGGIAGAPVVAGVGAGAAVLTRPNLAPVCAISLAAVVMTAYGSRRSAGDAVRAASRFAAPLAVAVAFLLWTNARLYGSAFQLGYGAVSGLFASGNVPINLGRYPRWLVETHTPLLLLGVLAPLLASFGRRSPRAPAPAHGWFGLAFAALVLACYLPYSPFDEWWYLRFLLPAIPVLLLLTTPVLVRLASCTPAAARGPLLVAAVALLAAHYLSIAKDGGVFDLRLLESRYVTAGAFTSTRLPGNALLLSMQESGPLRLYGGRTTVRYDRLDPAGLDAAVDGLVRAGFQPYFALEAWEEPDFRARFAPSSPLGLLDWPPMGEVGKPMRVRFFDPRDRQRYLAGEHVATIRDPGDARAAR